MKLWKISTLLGVGAAATAQKKRRHAYTYTCLHSQTPVAYRSAGFFRISLESHAHAQCTLTFFHSLGVNKYV